MAKPWAIVGGTGFDLEDVDNARTREMECPSCKRWARFVEKDLVKNLKVFGVSVIGVEDPKRVFACPACNTAIEPPDDAGLAKSDPRVAVLERKLAKLEDDEELWRRRVELAEKRGDDVLAAEARSVVERAREERDKIEREIAKLTAWDDDRDETPVVVARVKSSTGALETEGPSLDRAFASLKSKLSGVADAVKSAGESVGESFKDDERKAEPKRSPLVSSSEANEARKREVSIEEAADQELAALKARLKTGGAASASSGAPTIGEPSSAASVGGGPTASAVSEGSSRDEPSDQSRGGGDDFARSAVSSAELGLGMDYVPGPKAPGPTPNGPPPDDDDPVAALKRKLKKPSP
jgi:phage shock protein A